MSTPFNPARGLIVVDVQLRGPAGDRSARLALDTGSTQTLVRRSILARIGYAGADGADAAASRRHITTASGTLSVPEVMVQKVTALGLTRWGFPILSHTLPAAQQVDGVLGLDFLRGRRLTIDFRGGQINLA
jgi:hypothetical protein